MFSGPPAMTKGRRPTTMIHTMFAACPTSLVDMVWVYHQSVGVTNCWGDWLNNQWIFFESCIESVLNSFFLSIWFLLIQLIYFLAELIDMSAKKTVNNAFARYLSVFFFLGQILVRSVRNQTLTSWGSDALSNLSLHPTRDFLSRVAS